MPSRQNNQVTLEYGSRSGLKPIGEIAQGKMDYARPRRGVALWKLSSVGLAELLRAGDRRFAWGSGFGPAPAREDAKPKQNSQNRAVLRRPADIGFDQPVKMNHAGDCRKVNQPVQLLPAFAEAANHRRGGGEREGNHQYETGKADGHVGSLENVLADGAPVEKVVEHEIRRKVRDGVREGEEAEHAAQFDQIIPAGQTPERRYREAREQKNQRPGAGKARDRIDRIDSEIAGVRVEGKLGERNGASKEKEKMDNGEWIMENG